MEFFIYESEITQSYLHTATDQNVLFMPSVKIVTKIYMRACYICVYVKLFCKDSYKYKCKGILPGKYILICCLVKHIF